jgi:DNA-directed RNA polymerase subunit L
MSVAYKKQDAPQGVQQQQIHIQVNRDTVNSASRQTSVTINKMTDQIAREIAREVEKKQK